MGSIFIAIEKQKAHTDSERLKMCACGLLELIPVPPAGWTLLAGDLGGGTDGLDHPASLPGVPM